MPAPSSLISVNVILCEKVLVELDQTYTAVRITDVFYFRRDSELPVRAQAIPMSILVMGKTDPKDKSEHSVDMLLSKPDGTSAGLIQPIRAVFEARMNQEGLALLAEGSRAADIVGGFTIRADISIIPDQVGRHQIDVFMDDSLIARVPFTVLELKPLPTD
jgi:hypothetical protein